jgi:hypothetical protein
MDESSQLRQGGPDAPNRDSDFDLIARIGRVVERYKIFYIMAGALMAWWGRNVVVPLRTSAQTTGEVRILNVKMDSLKSQVNVRLDRADVDRGRMIEIQENQSMILGTLTRLQCLHTNAIDRVKINLDCKDIPIEIPRSGL